MIQTSQKTETLHFVQNDKNKLLKAIKILVTARELLIEKFMTELRY
jgi:hypothetical protein